MRGKRLTNKTLREIAQLRAEGESYERIAERLGLSKSTIHSALKGLVGRLYAANRTYLHAVLVWLRADALAAQIANHSAQRAEAEVVLALRDCADCLTRRANRHLRALGCAPVTLERVIEDASKVARGAVLVLPTEGKWGFLMRE